MVLTSAGGECGGAGAVNGGVCNHMGGGEMVVVSGGLGGTGGGVGGSGEDATTAIMQIIGASGQQEVEQGKATETNN